LYSTIQPIQNTEGRRLTNNCWKCWLRSGRVGWAGGCVDGVTHPFDLLEEAALGGFDLLERKPDRQFTVLLECGKDVARFKRGSIGAAQEDI